MSTTFEVYTPTKNIPSFNDVLSLSNKYLSEKLKKHDIDADYIIDVSIKKNGTNEVVRFDKSNSAVWAADEYAWFTVNEQPGGCDAYVHAVNGFLNLESWDYEFIHNERAKKIEAQMRRCLETDFYWVFRRSAGQPAIINLSYGLIAATFTELTRGFIFSSDSAWDYSMFPTTADHFLQNFFNLQYQNPEYANWAKECIAIIKNGESPL